MVPRLFWTGADGPAGSPGANIYTSKRIAPGTWTAKTLRYSTLTNPPINPPGFDPLNMGIEGFSASVLPDANDDNGLQISLDDVSLFGLNTYSLVPGNPPTTIDVDVAWAMTDYFSVTQGSWFYNGFWWTIQNVDLLAAPTRLRVYRSADRLNWVAMDVANEPLPWYGFTSWNWDGDHFSDGKIRCIYSTVAGSLTWRLVEFDMVTGTWGAPHDPVNLVFNVFPPRIHQLKYSAATGNVYILYHNGAFGWPPNPDLGVKYGFLTGGVWSTDIFILPYKPAGPSASNALLDPNGTTLHYIYIPPSFGGPETPGEYVRIDHGGALSNAHSFMLFNGVGYAAGYAYFNGHCVIDNDTILIPYAEPIDPTVDGSRRPSVFVGTPLINPVWTNENVDPGQMVQSPALFMGFGVAPPIPVPPPIQGSRRMTILVPNTYDRCLVQDYEVYRRYRPRKECCEVSPYYDLAWVRAPKNAIPFRKTAAIPTPLAISGDVTVLDFEVPEGYDGLIAGLFNVYNGPGFLEGNGDIEWRLINNKVYAIHLGRVLVTLGSQQQSYPLLGGIPVLSGTHVRYVVNVPNISGGILPLASQIVCGLEGLFYARR